MEIIANQSFGGERPLFGLRDVALRHVTIRDGESGIKCCGDIVAEDCEFIGKYPWWHVDHALLRRCHFAATARSAVWYSNDMTISDTVIDAPKLFREMHNVTINNVVINDADETFWRVHDLTGHHLTLHQGTYPFFFCENIRLDHLTSDALYIFQYCRNVELHHAVINTKDALWECDNVTIYDSQLHGEYLGWHSTNITLVRCHISGEQPLSYMNHVTLIDCSFDAACDRAFEDSANIQATIRGHITNIKNPVSGNITADSIGSVTIDNYALPPHNCTITTNQQ